MRLYSGCRLSLRSRVIKTIVRRGAVVIAASVVMAYVGIIAVSDVPGFAFLSADAVWLCVFAFVCGALLALASESAIQSVVAASALAVLIFASVWGYLFWRFWGEYFSLAELLVSNLFVTQVLLQGSVIFLITCLFGLFGVMATFFVPEHYRPG